MTDLPPEAQRRIDAAFDRLRCGVMDSMMKIEEFRAVLDDHPEWAEQDDDA